MKENGQTDTERRKNKKDQGKCILVLCKKRNKCEEDFKDPLNPHHAPLF